MNYKKLCRSLIKELRIRNAIIVGLSETCHAEQDRLDRNQKIETEMIKAMETLIKERR